MDEENKQQTSVKSGSGMVWILIVAVVVLIAGAAFYFLAPSNKSATSDSAMQEAESNAADTSETVMDKDNTTKQITVEGGEFTFTPSAINVSKGDTVELTFKNTGKFPHDYVIADLGVKTKTIKPGEQDTVTFVADKTGSFDFICSVGDHEEKGMVGKLTVE